MARLAQLEWDAGNWDKCQKHGVSIQEIDAVFANDPFTTPDEAHSGAEDRFIAVGMNGGGRLILVVFTVRQRSENEIIRPISARYMHRKEVEHYVKLGWQKGPKTHH